MANYTTGVTFRWGTTFDDNPEFAPYPELIDISISNRCDKNCTFCYRDSNKDGKLMDVDEYDFILNQLTNEKYGPVFQVALGGGEPCEHPDLIQIIKNTREKGIVPNLTTNGEYLTDELIQTFKQDCGAIALSMSDFQDKFSLTKLKKLVKRNVKFNIHYLLAKDTISDAIKILDGGYDHLLNGVNAVVFLTHKSMGRANEKNNLEKGELLTTFLSKIDNKQSSTRIGFDACFVPLLLRHTNIDTQFVDACECGFFSAYIDENLTVKPCSFSNNEQFNYSLKDFSLEEIWHNKFKKYRDVAGNQCSISCSKNNECRTCVYHSYLNLCH